MGQGEAAVHAEGGRALCDLLCLIAASPATDKVPEHRQILRSDTGTSGSPSSLTSSVSCLRFVIYAIQQNVIVTGKGIGVGEGGPGNITFST